MSFCETYNLQNLVKDPTCYKNPSKPTCIDLILTNFPKSFQHTQTIETGLSDFHKLTLTVLKTHFQKHTYSTNSRITLVENVEILSEEAKVADTFKELFSNVKELKINLLML